MYRENENINMFKQELRMDRVSSTLSDSSRAIKIANEALDICREDLLALQKQGGTENMNRQQLLALFSNAPTV